MTLMTLMALTEAITEALVSARFACAFDLTRQPQHLKFANIDGGKLRARNSISVSAVARP